MAAAQKKIERLGRVLAAYEAEFADIRLFLSQIIVKASLSIMLLVIIEMLAVFAELHYIVGRSRKSSISFAPRFRTKKAQSLKWPNFGVPTTHPRSPVGGKRSFHLSALQPRKDHDLAGRR
jgi:hypothetical protein